LIPGKIRRAWRVKWTMTVTSVERGGGGGWILLGLGALFVISVALMILVFAFGIAAIAHAP
jgi:hypothetical protein